MKRVLFFFYDGWVFGKIHHEMIKALYPEIYCDFMCWTVQYSIDDFCRIAEKYDFIITTPSDCYILAENYGVPYEKIIGVLHGDWDVQRPVLDQNNPGIFNKFAGYVAIAPSLQTVSLATGVERIPEVLRVGIFQHLYPRNVACKASSVGYFSKMEYSPQGFDIKRGKLAKKAAENAGIEFVTTNDHHIFVVEQLYKTVDLVMNSSLTEGNPYPMLEAFACGLPYLGTKAGMGEYYLSKGGGVLLPLDPEAFVEEATAALRRLKSDEDYYCRLSDESYEIGRSIDWSVIRGEWINYIYNLR